MVSTATLKPGDIWAMVVMGDMKSFTEDHSQIKSYGKI